MSKPAAISTPRTLSSPELSLSIQNTTTIAPAPPVAKKPAQFDASLLKTKQISHTGLGIALTAPNSWQETSNEKLLKLTDPNTATTI